MECLTKISSLAYRRLLVLADRLLRLLEQGSEGQLRGGHLGGSRRLQFRRALGQILPASGGRADERSRPPLTSAENSANCVKNNSHVSNAQFHFANGQPDQILLSTFGRCIGRGREWGARMVFAHVNKIAGFVARHCCSVELIFLCG